VGDASLDEVIKTTEVPGLFVIPSGPIPPNPAELFHTKAFRDFLAAVSTRFDRAVFDSPPVNAVADPAVLATQMDGVFLVLRADSTSRPFAKGALRVLTDVKARVFGAVLNDVEVGHPKYGGYYSTYRGYGADYGGTRESA
jgi:capsular exopolysaccharide synthesis family protein